MLHQISPPFDATLRRLGRCVGKTTKNFQIEGDSKAAGERRLALQFRSGFLHGSQRFQISNKGVEVFSRHTRIGLIRHHGDDIAVVTPDSFDYGVPDLLIRPTTESGFFVRGYIGAVNRSQGNRKSVTSRIEGAFRDRVASAAAAYTETILTLGDVIFSIGLGMHYQGDAEEKA